VSGWRLLAAFGIGVATSAAIGTTTYYVAHALARPFNPTIPTQVIVFEVYALLTLVIAIAFRPVSEKPLSLRFTSGRDVVLALCGWIVVGAISILLYIALTPLFGNIADSFRQLLDVATDAKHLQGAPVTAWAIAIPRGCLLAPLFEELFFRGALLQWLRGYMPNPGAILISAALFTVMHFLPLAMPFAFVFGVVAGWVRVRTGSTFNTLCMHILNNLLFLYLGIRFG
jgi:membrane protease YdiL (CAAX protease family)